MCAPKEEKESAVSSEEEDEANSGENPSSPPWSPAFLHMGEDEFKEMEDIRQTKATF